VPRSGINHTSEGFTDEAGAGTRKASKQAPLHPSSPKNVDKSFSKITINNQSNARKVKGRNSIDELAEQNNNIITLTVGSPGGIKTLSRLHKDALTNAELISDNDSDNFN